MIVAADFPLLGLFWTFLWLYLILALLMVLLRAVVGVFRNDSLGGAAKAIWLLAIIAFPLLGVVAYVVRHGDSMSMAFGPGDRNKDAAARAYVGGGMGYRGQPTRYY